ncbi:hypothetical protein [Desulfuromonas thiophila]|uniref:hypothetical protein n=1 Tax=Desulfuromonas thiophila TaxID=57664 RepID=UPI0029F54F94|nr:hypothetical protein [Desulfuromonas thiophila]
MWEYEDIPRWKLILRVVMATVLLLGMVALTIYLMADRQFLAGLAGIWGCLEALKLQYLFVRQLQFYRHLDRCEDDLAMEVMQGGTDIFGDGD